MGVKRQRAFQGPDREKDRSYLPTIRQFGLDYQQKHYIYHLLNSDSQMICHPQHHASPTFSVCLGHVCSVTLQKHLPDPPFKC